MEELEGVGCDQVCATIDMSSPHLASSRSVTPVIAARAAFKIYSLMSVDDRLALFDRIIIAYQNRARDLAMAVSEEMGALHWPAEQLQDGRLAHIQIASAALANYSFEQVWAPPR